MKGAFEYEHFTNNRLKEVLRHRTKYYSCPYGDKYYPGDWVHCNRFNGPFSDGVHYAKTNPKAYTNFISSDCDIALANSTVCWGWDYCNQSGPAAGCSIEIGHSTKYHKH